ILLMLHTGLRISDVALLRKDRVSNGKIFLYAKKNGIAVILPLKQVVLDALADLPDPAGAGVDCPFYFFNGKSVNSLMNRAQRLLHIVFRKSSVAGAHSHRFRHTLASNILAKGGTTDDVADVLGISPLIAQKHYIKMTVGRQERIERIMNSVNS
ncbi:MAG: tyrosine-type recombinase/integrase, partial [Acidobacteria bacterium]|nr:tyrosine-type recombinase/integrase [Acidobacteriota bacterium]